MFTKYQIALQYSPELNDNPVLAVRRLRIMIDRCTDLVNILTQTGYKKYSKTYTPQQVKLIYHFLGDPEIRCSDTTLLDQYILSESDYRILERNKAKNNQNSKKSRIKRRPD